MVLAEVTDGAFAPEPTLHFIACNRDAPMRLAVAFYFRGSVRMPSVAVSSNTVPPFFPPCPTCTKEMVLISITPTCESPIFGYICSDDGDRLSWQPRDYRAATGSQAARKSKAA